LPTHPPIKNLEGIFRKLARVKSAYQIQDSDKRMRDFGFVDFFTVEDA
jgi:hypothetical protein